MLREEASSSVVMDRSGWGKDTHPGLSAADESNRVAEASSSSLASCASSDPESDKTASGTPTIYIQVQERAIQTTARGSLSRGARQMALGHPLDHVQERPLDALRIGQQEDVDGGAVVGLVPSAGQRTPRCRLWASVGGRAYQRRPGSGNAPAAEPGCVVKSDDAQVLEVRPHIGLCALQAQPLGQRQVDQGVGTKDPVLLAARDHHSGVRATRGPGGLEHGHGDLPREALRVRAASRTDASATLRAGATTPCGVGDAGVVVDHPPWLLQAQT